MVELEILSTDQVQSKRQFVRADSGELRVGRGLSCDVILLDPRLSECEGTLRIEGSKAFWLRAGEPEPKPVTSKHPLFLPGFRVRPRALRRVIVSHSILVGLLGSFAFWNSFSTVSAKPTPLSPSQELTLPARGAYGKLRGDEAKTTSVRFRFEFEGKDGALLHYTPGNLRTASELAILLNGRTVGYAPPSEGKWGIEERLLLPPSQLRFGMNSVEFRFSKSKEAIPSWGVRDIYLTRVPSEQVQGDDPELLYAAAERLFLERNSQSTNLPRAKRLLQRAVGSWKAARGDVPEKAVRLELQLTRVESEIWSTHLSKARSAISMGDRRRAAQIYDRLLTEFLEPLDPRRVEVERLRSELR